MLFDNDYHNKYYYDYSFLPHHEPHLHFVVTTVDHHDDMCHIHHSYDIHHEHKQQYHGYNNSDYYYDYCYFL